MGELAGLLLDPNERAEPAVPLSVVKPKPENKKPVKPVFGKLAKRRIDAPRAAGQGIEVNRPYGERGDFEKVTVTLPSDVRGMLLEESLRRKKGRSPQWPIAAIVREAIAAYLSPKQ
jgi:hypothetical protein